MPLENNLQEWLTSKNSHMCDAVYFRLGVPVHLYLQALCLLHVLKACSCPLTERDGEREEK